MGSRLEVSDKRFIACTALALVASAAYVSYNYDAAFPQASLKLPLSRDQITRQAEEFLKTRALATSKFYNITLFDPDDDARLYLERELGLEAANRLMQSDAPVWRWRARWFKPPEKEELVVWLRPDGKLSGFQHRIPETDPGQRLDRLSARLLAQAFLEGQTSLPHKLVGEESESRPNRGDHSFTWEQQGFRAKDATIRRVIEVHGDKVGRYREYLFIPDQWQRDFSKLRSSNELYASIAQGLYALLGAGALFFLFDGLRKRLIPWRPLLILSLVVAGFNLLSGLNSLPFTIDSMSTTSTLLEMIVLGVLQALGSGSGVLIYVAAPLAAGYLLYRRGWPQHLAPDTAFLPAQMGTRTFFRATLAGVTMFAGHLIFLTAFYLYGAKFGVWSPQDVQYSDMLATPLPWVYPLAIALMASTAEEFWFRYLAIPMLQKLVRLRWLAIVIPAFTWGFLHANYPQQPGYVRGVEVGIIGVAAGFVMSRYGIVATLVWHYMIDAFLIGLSLFRAESWTYRAHGAIVAVAIAAPLLAVVYLYRCNGGFAKGPQVTSEGAPEKETPSEAELPAAVERPPIPMLWPPSRLFLATGVVAVLALLLRPSTFGEFLTINVTREQAEDAARAEMRARKLDPAAWRIVSDFSGNLQSVEFEYLRQQAGPERANQLIAEHLMHAVWQVRFFQPLNAEEWRFYVNAKGKVYRWDHTLDEKAPGAKPSLEEAQRIGELYLAAQGLAVHQYKLMDAQEEKRENRTDHTFVWESTAFTAGEARLRVSLQMIGDEPCQFRPFFKLPEAWSREFHKTRLTSFLPSAVLGIIGVPLTAAFFRRLGAREQRFHWRAYTIAAIAALLLAIVSHLSDAPTWLSGYDTSTPLTNYYGRLGTSLAVGVLLTSAGVFAAVLAVDTFRQAAIPLFSLPEASLARAAAVAVLAGSMNSLLAWLWQHAPGQHLEWRTASTPDMDTLLPALDSLIEAALQSALAVCLIGALVCGSLILLRRKGLLIATTATVLALSLARVAEPLQTPFAVVCTLLSLGALVLILLTCTLDAVSVGVGLFWAVIAGEVAAMLTQPMPFLRWNGGLACAVALIVGVWIIRRYNQRHIT